MSSRPPPRSASFYGGASGNGDRPVPLRRPGSHQELPRCRAPEGGGGQRLTKLLLNVTVERSPGPIHVVISPEETVADLIRAAVQAYAKEGRRPLLARADPGGYELHYSQYSLESLRPKGKLIDLGSRTFFLCSKPTEATTGCCSSQASGRSLLMCLADLEFDYINPFDSASRINKVIYPEFALQGVLCLLFLLSGHWLMFLFCIPNLYYNVRLYQQRQHLIDVTEIFNLLNREKKQRLIKLGYLVFLLFLSLFWMIWSVLEDED